MEIKLSFILAVYGEKVILYFGSINMACCVLNANACIDMATPLLLLYFLIVLLLNARASAHIPDAIYVVVTGRYVSLLRPSAHRTA